MYTRACDSGVTRTSRTARFFQCSVQCMHSLHMPFEFFSFALNRLSTRWRHCFGPLFHSQKRNGTRTVTNYDDKNNIGFCIDKRLSEGIKIHQRLTNTKTFLSLRTFGEEKCRHWDQYRACVERMCACTLNGFERLSVRLCRVYFRLYYYWHWLHPCQKVKWQHKNKHDTFLNFSILDKSEFPLSWSLLLCLTTEEDSGYKKSTVMVPWCLCGTKPLFCVPYRQ